MREWRGFRYVLRMEWIQICPLVETYGRAAHTVSVRDKGEWIMINEIQKKYKSSFMFTTVGTW